MWNVFMRNEAPSHFPEMSHWGAVDNCLRNPCLIYIFLTSKCIFLLQLAFWANAHWWFRTRYVNFDDLQLPLEPITTRPISHISQLIWFAEYRPKVQPHHNTISGKHLKIRIRVRCLRWCKFLRSPEFRSIVFTGRFRLWSELWWNLHRHDHHHQHARLASVSAFGVEMNN